MRWISLAEEGMLALRISQGLLDFYLYVYIYIYSGSGMFGKELINRLVQSSYYCDRKRHTLGSS